MNIKVKRICEEAKLPTRGSEKAAAYDVYACLPDENAPVAIMPHQTMLIGIGLRMAPPKGFYVGVYARSGLSSKEGLRPANCVGVIDEDYRGEYLVAVHNDSEVTRSIRHGDRIAQILLQKRYDMDFEEVDELDTTGRGEGGFGSTGKQ